MQQSSMLPPIPGLVFLAVELCEDKQLVGILRQQQGEYVVLAGGAGENTADILDTLEIFDISIRTWQAAAGSLLTPIAQGQQS